MPGGPGSPKEADGSIPPEPGSIAAPSGRRSPERLSVQIPALLLLPEVRPAGQLADDEYVHATEHFLFERRGGEQRRYRRDGAQVGERPEVLAQLEQAG